MSICFILHFVVKQWYEACGCQDVWYWHLFKPHSFFSAPKGWKPLGIPTHSPVSAETCVALSPSHSPSSARSLYTASFHPSWQSYCCQPWLVKKAAKRQWHCPTGFIHWWIPSCRKNSQAILLLFHFHILP